MGLKDLGYDEWFRERSDVTETPGVAPCRIISVHKNSYYVSNGDVDLYAEAAGNLLHAAGSPLDLPAVGDWVMAHLLDDDTFGVIHALLPRRTRLTRKIAGKKVDFQLIAANVDVALIVQGLDADFNVRRLERYLAMVSEGGIEPAVLLSKSDLVSADLVEARIRQVHELTPAAEVVAYSCGTGQGLDSVRKVFVPGKTYCLIGSSGVGKTTLLNLLVGEERFRTVRVRESDGKGRHATTARQLVRLAGGALMIDTPGMRELGAIAFDSGIEETFGEVVAVADCRFGDCSHTSEPGCGILAALDEGRITRGRYEAYMKLKRESEFHEMSLQERRHRDREFGKMVKSVMKHKKGRKRR